MILERTEHPAWLSNAYLVADGPGGEGALVDGNGVLEPLLALAERERIRLSRILVTHAHADHVAGLAEAKERLGAVVVAHADAASQLGGLADETVGAGDAIPLGRLELNPIETPGHAPGHLAFLLDSRECFTADVLFRGSVGGTRGGGPSGFADLRRSIMERLMTLPPETRLHPGHSDPTTVAEEWESNPFVRIWRGVDPEGSERCRAAGEEATLVLWARDYDGGHKAWVRLASGQDAIVGGSQVERR